MTVLDRVLVVGGAGFIGSHLVRRLLDEPSVSGVTVFDNFSSGGPHLLQEVLHDPRLAVVEADVVDLEALVRAAEGHTTVVHLASNPDIAAAATSPSIDFDQGTRLTHHVAEAARRAGVSLVLYASGSGVYGDLGLVEAREDHGPLEPTSTYGASKLAGEALLSSYAHMFGLHCRAFRFGNVVGARQTHGVGHDFLRRLREDPTTLRVLGDGRQSKSYIHVDDVIDAVLLAASDLARPFDAFNVATGDYLTVDEIAALAIEVLGLSATEVRLEHTGGSRGWKGDVPVVRIATDKIRSLGWSNRRSSAEAMTAALEAMLADLETGVSR